MRRMTQWQQPRQGAVGCRRRPGRCCCPPVPASSLAARRLLLLLRWLRLPPCTPEGLGRTEGPSRCASAAPRLGSATSAMPPGSSAASSVSDVPAGTTAWRKPRLAASRRRAWCGVEARTTARSTAHAAAEASDPWAAHAHPHALRTVTGAPTAHAVGARLARVPHLQSRWWPQLAAQPDLCDEHYTTRQAHARGAAGDGSKQRQVGGCLTRGDAAAADDVDVERQPPALQGRAGQRWPGGVESAWTCRERCMQCRRVRTP